MNGIQSLFYLYMIARPLVSLFIHKSYIDVYSSLEHLERVYQNKQEKLLQM